MTEMVREREELSEEERRALRGSKFASLPSLPPSSSRSQPRFQFFLSTYFALNYCLYDIFGLILMHVCTVTCVVDWHILVDR